MRRFDAVQADLNRDLLFGAVERGPQLATGEMREAQTMRCLIVDDETICRKAVALILKEVAHCDEAVDGSEAVLKFSEALQKDEPYDVIFLDIIMPGMDGHETAREIRKLEREVPDSAKVKIIMLTVLDSVNEAMKSFRYAHSIAYMVKPPSEERFIKTFKEVGLL